MSVSWQDEYRAMQNYSADVIPGYPSFAPGYPPSLSVEIGRDRLIKGPVELLNTWNFDESTNIDAMASEIENKVQNHIVPASLSIRDLQDIRHYITNRAPFGPHLGDREAICSEALNRAIARGQ